MHSIATSIPIEQLRNDPDLSPEARSRLETLPSCSSLHGTEVYESGGHTAGWNPPRDLRAGSWLQRIR